MSDMDLDFLSSMSMENAANREADFSSLSHKDKNTYFGEKGRASFNERCQMIKRHSKIVTSSTKEKICNTYFGSRGSIRDSTRFDSKIIGLRRHSSKNFPKQLQPLALRDGHPTSLAEISIVEPLLISPLNGIMTTFPPLTSILSRSASLHNNGELLSQTSKCESNDIVPGSHSNHPLIPKFIETTISTDGLSNTGKQISGNSQGDDNTLFVMEKKSRNLVDDVGNIRTDDNNYDDDDRSIDSTDSVIENQLLSEIAEKGYKVSSVAQPLTPRTRFISACIREGLNPRASLVIRRHMSTHLKLSHFAIGDKVACILAASLVDLPEIESIDISYNMLTDISLEPFLHAISSIKGILELNLSSNIIGPRAAKAVSDFLSSSNCPLKTLILQNADVDDYECEQFITSIKSNSVLTEIDLSNNKIGSAEALNVVKPDLITGGEAIAELLRSPMTQLQSLKLSWNMIRLHSAVDLASSLSVNTSLLYLDLSCNSLGKDGGEALGDALLANRSLKTLIISSNGIEAKACFTICMSIIENGSLRKVCLDGNPIGESIFNLILLIRLTSSHRKSLQRMSMKYLCIYNSVYVAKRLRFLRFFFSFLLVYHLHPHRLPCSLHVPILNLYHHLIYLLSYQGIQGAKALMAIPMAVGDRVSVTSVGCNIDIRGNNTDLHLV